MLHKYCDKVSFVYFLGHLKAKLTTLADKLGNSFEKLVFSTDEDLGCVSALEYLFPKNIKLLCTRHIRNNFIKNCKTTSGTLVSRLSD